ncbi:hypothetical protein KDM41_18395, partial [bacterium]|nr:hypothetical protein [bacterium]
MSFTLRVENLRALRKVEWAPEGVCALVGANGAGKTTLLMVLKFLKLAFDRSVDQAFEQVFGSSRGLRHRQAGGESICIELAVRDRRWQLKLNPHGANISYPVSESYYEAGELAWARSSSGDFAEFPDGKSAQNTV